jgi:hypothetical protein
MRRPEEPSVTWLVVQWEGREASGGPETVAGLETASAWAARLHGCSLRCTSMSVTIPANHMRSDAAVDQITGAQNRRFLTARLITGVVVLLAAMLKIDPLWSAYASSESPLASLIERGGLLVVFEVFLGCWLLWGELPGLLWIITGTTLAAMVITNLILGISGWPSCGCFGRILVSPWLTLGLDCGLIGLLTWGRPSSALDLRGFLKPSSESLAGALQFFAGTFVLLAILFLILPFVASPGPMTDDSQVVTISPDMTELGEVQNAEVRDVTVTISNASSLPVRIVGGPSGCTVVTVDDLPVEIPAYGSADLRVRIDFYGAASGAFRRQFEFFYELGGLRAASASVSAKIVQTDKPTKPIKIIPLE